VECYLHHRCVRAPIVINIEGVNHEKSI